MTAKTNFSSSILSSFSSAPIIWVLVLVGFLLFFRLGERPLRNPDEGRYAEIAREMSASGDWEKPTLYGVGYLRKPPFFYWLTAGSFRLFGENEFSARAVPAFFSLLSVLLVYWFGNRFFDRDAALYASLILGTNLWYVQVGRYLVIDAVYSFFLMACLFFFYAAMHSEDRKNVFPGLFFISLSCAFLTKGPSSLVLVGFPILIYLVWKKKWKTLWKPSWVIGLLLFFLAVLPWFIEMERREPGFLNFFFLHEHIQRFVSPDFEHQEPWFYYLWMLPLLFVPWSLYRRTWVANEKKDARHFLWIAVFVTLLFFSVSRSKLPTYILPCFPFMALLAADSWKYWLDSQGKVSVTNFFPVLLLMLASLFCVVGAPIFLNKYGQKYPPQLVSDLQLLGGVGLASSVFAARILRRGQPRRFFFALIFISAALCFCAPKIMETMNSAYSTKNFAAKLRSRLTVDEDVFIYDHPGPFYDFAFYLKRPVKLVGLEGELVYSKQDPKAKEVSISREEFFSRIREKKPLVALMRQSDFFEMEPALRSGLHVLAQDNRKILVEVLG